MEVNVTTWVDPYEPLNTSLPPLPPLPAPHTPSMTLTLPPTSPPFTTNTVTATSSHHPPSAPISHPPPLPNLTQPQQQPMATQQQIPQPPSMAPHLQQQPSVQQMQQSAIPAPSPAGTHYIHVSSPPTLSHMDMARPPHEGQLMTNLKLLLMLQYNTKIIMYIYLFCAVILDYICIY